MASARTAFALRRGNWTLRVSPEGRLALRHRPTGTDLTGPLTFTVRGQPWRLVRWRDGVAGRPAWLDPAGNVQGYLVVRHDGDRLELRVVHRCAQSYAGTLLWEPEAAFGTQSFACRLQAPRHSRVVQMAAGPADSRLNDGLFDIDSDTALRFEAATVAIASRGGNRFGLRLSAEVDQAADAAVVLDLQQHAYASRYVPHYRPLDRRRCPVAPTGWMSWNRYFDTAGAEENLAEARLGARHLKPFGLEFWSIESWQANSDRLPVCTFHNLDLSCHPGQFPEGMKALAGAIRDLGFRPGLWTVPFGTGDRAFYEAHRNWFLHDAADQPMRNWSGLYVLDPSQPAVRAHLREMHRVMSRDWGYEFFKVDGMSGRQEGYSAHFFEREAVRIAFREPCENPMAACVEALREGMGPDRVFLACQGHYSGPEAGQADAARIGGDIVAPNRDSTWENILSQARATLNQLFVHGIVWYNDPDTLLVGPYHGLEQARVTAVVVALPGQVMFAGDRLAELSSERLRLLQQALPVCAARPLDLFPIFELRPIWDLKIRRPFGAWDVVAVFNWSDQDDDIDLCLEDLGLPPSGAWRLYDVWERRGLGRTCAGVRLRVPARGVRLVTVHADAGRPQWLASDRHLTQGAVELRDLSWDTACRRLALRLDLVADSPVELAFHVPEGDRLRQATADGAAITASHCDHSGLLRLSLVAPTAVCAALTLDF